VAGEVEKLLRELIEEVKGLGGGFLTSKPKETVYSLGKFIVDRTLPPGKWIRVLALPEEHSPYLVYWKIINCDSPDVKCLCFEDGVAVCEDGCDLKALNNLGVTSFNDRGWVHVYDTVNDKYGMQCNILRPIKGRYEFAVMNYGATACKLTVLYTKWYQWTPVGRVEIQ